MKKSSIDQTFDHIDLMLSDFSKILSAQDQAGNFANVGACGFGLQITEPIAKICFPKLNPRLEELYGEGLEAVDASTAVKQFWSEYFDPRYKKFAEFIWKSYRHTVLHLYKTVKVVGVELLSDDEESFLTGSAISSPKHLNFSRTNNGRPFFIFAAHNYFLDLSEAIEKMKKNTKSNADLRSRIERGWDLYGRSYRVRFNGLKDKEILEAELKQLLTAPRLQSDDSAIIPSQPSDE